MTWFVVGGIAIGATAGAVVGSKKGGDDVWKDALIGGAIGGTAGAGAGVAGGAGVLGGFGAEAGAAAVPAAVAPEAAGILGAGEIGGSGLALGGAGLETGGAMAGGAGIVPSAAAFAPEAAALPTGAAALPGAFGSGAATVGETGGFAGVAPEVSAGFAPGMQAPIQMISNPALDTFGSSTLPTGATPLPGGSSFGSSGVPVGDTGGAWNLGGTPDTGNAFTNGFDKAIKWVSDNPLKAGILGIGALSMTGALNKQNNQTFGNPQVTPVGYPLAPGFKPSRVSPQDYWYTPRYAEGGSVGSSGDNTDWGKKMIQYAAMRDNRLTPLEAPSPTGRGDPGIYYDEDPDTKYQDALTAAQTRMSKLAGKANVKLGAMQKPTPLGQIDLNPVVKARQGDSQGREEGYAAGGIMQSPTPSMMQSGPANVNYMGSDMYPQSQIERNYYNTPSQMPTSAQQVMASYEPKTNPLTGEAVANMASGGITSLGGYASGGNPHLLRGPGDGMSDDIPASIANKQPARLADGEFVVPADVVSGLGNGSTEAGAKKLHQMMDKVRVDRTGTKKQGKQIKADKYLPSSGGKTKKQK